jgi:prepilin signal peptidase PulO-like enzyme (type II secretory pathway)
MESFILLIITIIFGALFGNFATTFYYRLPRGLPINGGRLGIGGKAPHCSVCNHQLRYYEYLPIINIFSTFGKCNYCGVKVDHSYHLLELGGVITAVLLFFQYNISFTFIAKLIYAILAILWAALCYKYRVFYKSLIIMMLGVVLMQPNIYSSFAIMLGIFFSSAIYRKFNLPLLMVFCMLTSWTLIIYL